MHACRCHRSGAGVGEACSCTVGTRSRSRRPSTGGSVGEPMGVDGSVPTCACSIGARTWSIGRGVVVVGPVGGPEGAAMARA